MPQYSVRGRVRRVRVITECKQLVFDVTKEVPDLTEYFRGGDGLEDIGEGRDWYIQAEIICPPIVILVLCREVEAKEGETDV